MIATPKRHHHHCLLCEHEWFSRVLSPDSCPRCQSRRWQDGRPLDVVANATRASRIRHGCPDTVQTALSAAQNLGTGKTGKAERSKARTKPGASVSTVRP